MRPLRTALVLLGVFVSLSLIAVGFQTVRILWRLNVVEAERDQWQRPLDINRALNITTGSMVVDLGSGAGYFSLKLSDAVGPGGQVLAVDLRPISLFFLRTRAFLQRKRNIRIIIGEPIDPRLPDRVADAVLVLNTWHELSDPQSMLRFLSTALRPDRRLVVVDRAPGPGEHNVSAADVEVQLRQGGFDIISREDSFTKDPDGELWWMIVASKP